MQHFDLCYRIEGTNEYIAPQLLPIEENKLADIPSAGAIMFWVDYTFMPAGLITRLIARMSRHIRAPHVWRTGVTLEWEEGTIAEVTEHQLTHEIVIRINGVERKRRLAEIRKTLYDLHEDFRGLKFEELVSCNCVDCQKGGNVTTFELLELEDNAAHGDEMICRNGNRKRIAARDVLEGISYEDKPRIFISYAHRNEELKNEFRTMIRPMEKEGHWKVWDDRWLLPGDIWNREILKHLDEANVIVLMLTKEFFASEYIYDVELSRAIKRHEQGDAMVIGIVVSDCLWEKTPLCKILILPKDALAVEKHPHKDEVWKSAAKTIEETINIWQGKQGRKGGW
ncbi:MAG: hypothetical protein K0Q79_3127 [Flavipsychrobacter sp.]|jgi:internalin A|nr:hypothetical protein [Flavipsychrobacter sp.]